MRIRITNLPEPGFKIAVGEHEYTLADYVPHLRADGNWTRLGVWFGHCSACQKTFETRSPLHIVPETRRCELHRKPGKKA